MRAIGHAVRAEHGLGGQSCTLLARGISTNAHVLEASVVLPKRPILKQHRINIDILIDELIGHGKTLFQVERKVSPQLQADTRSGFE
jgi:hypothetical protein